jgi:hypothetical protein
MGAVGDLNAFVKFKAAQSLEKLAQQGGGVGSGAMGMGLGAGFGMMLPGMLQQAMAGQTPPPTQPAAPQPPAVPPSSAAAPLAPGVAGVDFSGLAAVKADPRQVVRATALAGGYSLVESGDHWQATVQVGPLRKQVVHIEFSKTDDAGHPLVAFWSICGPATPENATALLRYNTGMVQGAFAVKTVDATEMVVLQANHLAETLDALAVSRTISAIAWQADQVEQKLIGEDRY